jgi:hypothetical protein
MKNHHVGISIIAISIVFLFLVFSFNSTLETITNESCMHGESCPMYATLDIQKAISYSLIAILILVGVAITFFLKDKVAQVSKEQVTEVVKAAVEETVTTNNANNANSQDLGLTDAKKQQILASVEGVEQQIIQLIINCDGSIYQSDLTKELNLTKVKVTRLLDRLEGKGLIERKRRGMTNVVVLK